MTRSWLWLGLGLGSIPAVVAASALSDGPRWGPPAALVFLALAIEPWARAWHWSRGTALRPAAAWLGLALLLGTIAELQALGEPAHLGRPWTGHWSYLCTLATLAAGISVLNARQPGNGAWALLMGLLVLVFLIPWLEAGGIGRAVEPARRLRLEAPWSLFFITLALAVVTNFLPTRAGLPALCVGAGFALEYLALTRVADHPETRALIWTIVPVACVGAPLLIGRAGAPASRATNDLDRLWVWFRDHWGVVWTLRVQDRFNREAAVNDWPIRMSWHGVVSTTEDGLLIPPEAVPALRGLLRRFADAERLDAESRP